MGFSWNNPRHWVVLVLIRVLVIYTLNVSTVLAATNVTIDDTDTSIGYAPAGAWGQPTSPFDFGGSHHITSTGGTASFTFTGIAIYFMSPLWPYIVNTAVSLDSGSITLVDLTDRSQPFTAVAMGNVSETVQSQVVWSATGLANTQHTLHISVGAGQTYAVVDGLIYTLADASSSLSSSQSPTSDPIIVSSSSSSTSASTSTSLSASTSTSSGSSIPSSTANAAQASSPNSSSHSKLLAIIFGSLFGVLGLLIILFALWYFLRRRKPKPSTVHVQPFTSSPSMSAIRQNNYGQWPGNQLGDNTIMVIGSSTQPSDTIPSDTASGHTWNNPRYERVGTSSPPPTPPHSYPSYGKHQDNIGSHTGMHRPLAKGRNLGPDEPPGYAMVINNDRMIAQMGDGRNY